MKTASRMTSAQIAAHKKSNPHRKLAKKIARSLFTDGSGNHAQRLELKHGKLGFERAGGGWCEAAVEDVIADMLWSNTPDSATEGRSPEVAL
jgi:hypothetical protein